MTISVKQVERFVPFQLRDRDGGALPGAQVYLLNPPSYMTKARFRRAVGEAGAWQPDQDEMVSVLRRGVTERVAEHQQPQWLSLIDEWDAGWRNLMIQRLQAGGKPAEIEAAAQAFTAVSARMMDFEAQMRTEFPPYARLLSARHYYFEVAPMIAARHFLCGWENVDLPFALGPDGLVPEALLDQLQALHPGHAPDAGWIAMGLQHASVDAVKNSEGASASSASPPASPKTRKAPGPASTKSSRKTRERASQPGSAT
jgi:hypothetical protein